MKILRRVFLGVCLCFSFVLAACSNKSNVSQSYADKVNNSYKAGNTLTYETVKSDLNDECIDVTNDKNGVLVAIKGVPASNYQEKLDKAKDDEKFEFISITVIKGNCTYAYYALATKTEITSSIINSKVNN